MKGFIKGLIKRFIKGLSKVSSKALSKGSLKVLSKDTNKMAISFFSISITFMIILIFNKFHILLRLMIPDYKRESRLDNILTALDQMEDFTLLLSSLVSACLLQHVSAHYHMQPSKKPPNNSG